MWGDVIDGEAGGHGGMLLSLLGDTGARAHGGCHRWWGHRWQGGRGRGGHVCVLGGLLVVDAVVEVVRDLVLIAVVVVVLFPLSLSPSCCRLCVAPTSTSTSLSSLC